MTQQIIDKPETKSQYKAQNLEAKKGKGNLASVLSLKSHGPPTHPTPPHLITFRGSGWEYRVKIEAPSTPECWEGVTGPGGQREEEHRVVLHVQVKHYQKKSIQRPYTQVKIPGLVPVDYESNNFSVQMQKENFGKGVTIGQRIGLSFCDELKLRRFYAEPGIRGRKQCEVWSPRC